MIVMIGTMDYIRYSTEFLSNYLEERFHPGISWENGISIISNLYESNF